MTLVRTSLLSALAVLTKLATTIFINKVLAVYVGPSGYGVIGQLQSLIAVSNTFASGAVNTSGSLIGAVVAAALVIAAGLSGALITLAIGQVKHPGQFLADDNICLACRRAA